MPGFHHATPLGTQDAAAIKQVVTHALVTAEARVKTPERAEAAIASGLCDLVSIVRGQIADPHLANKAREGRADDIRPCISCNQLCIGRRMRDYHISCLVNPSVGREHAWDGDSAPPAETPRQVLVVGGGPAGLETARVAAERGHRVTLVEKAAALGGQFRLAAAQPERDEIGELLGWYRSQLEKLQVRVELGTELGPDAIRDFGADAVVLSTGSVSRPAPGSSAPSPTSTRCPASSRRTSVPSMTFSRAPPGPASGSFCSTTSTGGGPPPAPRCTSPNKAMT